MSCVRPIIEYAASCWSPTSDKMNKKLEMVQHKAAKFVTNKYPRKGHYEDFSISAIISELEWDSLEERREEIKLNMVYKIINGKVILPPDCLPRVNHNRPTRGCSEVPVGAANQLVERPTRLITTAKTFFYSGPQLWNMKVTPTRANAPSIDAFKNRK